MKKTEPIQRRKGAMRRKRARKAKWAAERQSLEARLRGTYGYVPPRYDDLFFQGVAWLNSL